MNKVSYWLLLATLPLTICSCGEKPTPEPTAEPTVEPTVEPTQQPTIEPTVEPTVEPTEEPEPDLVFDESMYYDGEEVNTYYHSPVGNYSSTADELAFNFEEKYHDSKNNLNNTTATYGELYLNGEKIDNLSEGYSRNDDANYLFYGLDKARVISRSKGYAFTLPTSTIIEPNFQFNQYRTQYSTKDYVLTISEEYSNPYGNGALGWATYHDEWLTRYLTGKCTHDKHPNGKKCDEGFEDWRIERFMTNNNLSYVRDPFYSTSIIQGYETELISMKIEDNENIEMPYYNFAIIRKPSNYKDFYLLVMKSANEFTNQFDSIVNSFTPVTKYGISKNCGKFELKVPRYLNRETQEYYKQLMEQDYTGWGIFNHSMSTSKSYTTRIEQKNELWKEWTGYDFDIAPTYTHCGNYNNPGMFPMEDALKFAGGNGKNGKPVIQFTMQFTANNNTQLHDYTPMYDILRGKYDSYFAELGKQIKEYGAPVLLRLNNEMNSDWVSYCAMVTMLDPDIFAMTWERMASIFKEVGADNILYIFNPTGKTFPYCNWGEDVHILGLTYYEYNNYEDQDPVSFFDLYQELYEKNTPYWNDYPAIISEFGCGSGGNYPTGKKYRNVITQAVWVEEMFDLLNYSRKDYPFLDQIKGAIWFNANDDVGNKTQNLLIIDMDNTPTTIEMFAYGLQCTAEIKNKSK